VIKLGIVCTWRAMNRCSENARGASERT